MMNSLNITGMPITSNTEPIIRIYSEASTMEKAEALGNEVIAVADKIINA